MVKETNPTGLNILLSVVTLLFLIGLVIMIFTLFGAEVGVTTDETIVGSIVNETLLFTNGTGTGTSVAGTENLVLSNVVVEGCI